ncbi:MAG: phosphate ABC transporter substrate-binding protein [Mariprofundaceae bacterium]|nr:phosphate ABC transporter substrate-binding protein [Mariprofundaceae bacterium]
MNKIALFVISLCISHHAIAAERIAIVGSTTVLPVLSQAAALFHQQHPEVIITVSGGGSGVGIAAVIQKTAQIGMASRMTTSEEEAKLSQVDNIVIAADAVAMAVSSEVYDSGIHQLSLQQIAAIYRGKVRNWQELGGLDARIVVIDKEASRGTRHVFAKAVLGNKHARAAGATLISGSNNEEQGIIARSNQAIGMLSHAWLNKDVRGIAIVVDGQAIAPNMVNVRNGSYPLARELRVLLPKDASPMTRDFINFLLSPQGQGIVEKAGYLPVL